MTRTIVFAVCVLIAMISSSADAQESGRTSVAPHAAFLDPQRAAILKAAFPKIDSLMRNFAKRSRVPGIAYGIVVDGRLAHLGTAGLRHLSSRSPVDSGTVFRIASMTKSFTALAILQLRDAGRLSLDDPAERYVPELVALRLPSTDSPRITIRHLLSHSAGFPEDNPWGDQQLAATDDEMATMMRSGIPFSTAPGTAYEYSNYGFAILGRIVANVSGMPYSRYVSEHILQPLGMNATTLEALHRTGGLQPRVPQPAPVLVERRDQVSRLVSRWNDGLADSVAAMNLYLDESKDRRRTAIQRLRLDAGDDCRNEGPFLVTNALRGRWRMRCRSGDLLVSITLAPTEPANVQFLQVTPLAREALLEPGPTCVSRP